MDSNSSSGNTFVIVFFVLLILLLFVLPAFLIWKHHKRSQLRIQRQAALAANETQEQTELQRQESKLRVGSVTGTALGVLVGSQLFNNTLFGLLYIVIFGCLGALAGRYLFGLGKAEQGVTLKDMASRTSRNLDEKLNTMTGDSLEKMVQESDRAAIKDLLEQARNNPQDKYSEWFKNEAQYALNNDLQCAALLSSVIGFLDDTRKNSTPKAFTNMTQFEAFHSLYIATLDHYNQQPYFTVG